MNPLIVIVDIVLLIAGGLLGYFIHRYQAEREMQNQQQKADSILKGANEQARLIETQARDNAVKIVQAAEAEIKERRIEVNRETERLDKRRTELETRAERMEQREQALNKRQSTVDKRANEIDKLYQDEADKLQEIAQMTTDQARKELFASVEQEARGDMARIIRQIEAEAREEGEKRARKLIADAIQRVASEHVAEVTRAVVTLPNEEMKGRIVGRNGRNIKAFEQAAGVDVIVDDTPDSVTISCFDSVRREIGRRALGRLIQDGRIHPAHIEKIVEDETKAVEKIINEAGEQAAFDAGVTGLHPEVMRMMGRLKFRTSYGQNQLAHAVEVSKLAGILAAELGADVMLAKQGGFLHDIG
ncbi:MAG TPA: Rnase Y domain-containing protein, partial [Anaerolineales bacterium]